LSQPPEHLYHYEEVEEAPEGDRPGIYLKEIVPDPVSSAYPDGMLLPYEHRYGRGENMVMPEGDRGMRMF
jgi:hypothetical protein